MVRFQPSLFASVPAFDRSFASLVRTWLDPLSWIDYAPGWVSGADALFERIAASRSWKQRTRTLYDKRRIEPRLTAPWRLGAPLGRGDLLVTGGRTQRDWDHAVPKVASAGPRISLAFRYGMSAGVYET